MGILTSNELIKDFNTWFVKYRKFLEDYKNENGIDYDPENEYDKLMFEIYKQYDNYAKKVSEIVMKHPTKFLHLPKSVDE